MASWEKWAVVGALVGCTQSPAPVVDARAPAPVTIASASPPAPSIPFLTGREIPIGEAVASTRAVVVARLEALGNPNPAAPGQQYYDGASAVVVRPLSGSIPAASKVALSYTVQVMPAEVAEEPPRLGVDYILFLTPVGDHQRATKILLATDANVAAVLRARQR